MIVLFLIISIVQDDTYTDSYISTIGVDFVSFLWLGFELAVRTVRTLMSPPLQINSAPRDLHAFIYSFFTLIENSYS